MNLKLRDSVSQKNYKKTVSYNTIGSWLDARCEGAKDIRCFPDDREYSYNYMSYFKDLDCHNSISPGSNRSNAYYLKEVLINALDGFNENPVNLPYVTEESVYNICGDFGFSVSEQSIYHFIFSVSTKDHNSHKYTDKTYKDMFTEYAQKGIMYNYVDFFSDIEEGNLQDYMTDEADIKKMSNYIKIEMMRILDFAKNVWDAVIVPFIYSSDCNTLDYLSDRDYWIFEEFIKSSSIYYIMENTLMLLDKKIKK